MDVKTKQQKQMKLKETCDACGLPKSDVKGTSLTGWIFGKACHCISVPKDNSADGENQSESAQTLTNISDRYETLAVIGSGGMGTVYRVKDKTLDKVFALKVLRSELAGDREAVSRFKQEISAAQNLSHANLVSVYDWGVSTDGSPYFVMDYVEGQSLADLLKAEQTLNLQRCINIMMQALEAVAHAHDHGIIHRDLKPSNIIITTSDDGTEFVKVVDFGIAKILPPPGKDTVSLTKTAEIFGSPAYMSPEQCKGERVDRRCDIYAFGCVMFECLIGKPPFARENPVKTILAHIYDQPPSVRSKLIGYSAPDAVAAVINRCLSKDPSDRYGSSKELLDDLELLRDGKPPLALTRISKEKRRRQLKFLGFKYFPQTLTVFTIVLLIMAIVDSPWLLALAGLHQPNVMDGIPRARLANILVERADAYNKPFALFMGAEADMASGLTEEGKDKALKAIAAFKTRNDFPGTVLATRLLVTEYLRENKIKPALEISEDLNEMLVNGLDKKPKKGMRLLGWFYLPNINPDFQDIQSYNARSMAEAGHTAEAEQLMESTLAAVRKRIAANPAKSQAYQSQETSLMVKYMMLLLSTPYTEGHMQKAGRILHDLPAHCQATKTAVNSHDIDDVGELFLANNDIHHAIKAFELNNDYYYGTDRELGLALCKTLLSQRREADAHYDKAIKFLMERQMWQSGNSVILTKFAGIAYDATGNLQTMDLFFDQLLAAAERTEKNETWMRTKLSILNEYANAKTLSGRESEAKLLRKQAEKFIPDYGYGTNDLYQQISSGYLMDNLPHEANRLLCKEMGFHIDQKRDTDIGARDQLKIAATIALSGDPKKAAGLLEDLLEQNTNLFTIYEQANAQAGRATIAFHQKDFEKAKNYYELSIYNAEHSNTFTDGLISYSKIQLAEIALSENKIDNGLDILKHGLVQPTSEILRTRALRLYGELLLRKGNKEAAEIAFNRAKGIEQLRTTGDTMEQTIRSLNYTLPALDSLVNGPVRPVIVKKKI